MPTAWVGPAGAGVMLARRPATAGLRIAPDGIVVRGPLKTRSIPLAEADAFVPGILAGAGNGTPCPMLNRTHAHPVGVWALGKEGVAFGFDRLLQELEPVCDELNGVLKSLQSEAATVT